MLRCGTNARQAAVAPISAIQTFTPHELTPRLGLSVSGVIRCRGRDSVSRMLGTDCGIVGTCAEPAERSLPGPRRRCIENEMTLRSDPHKKIGNLDRDVLE
jgi:hypothetical protein